MTRYENLICYAENIGAKVIERDFDFNDKLGWCIDNRIYINSRMTENEKYEVLSEEIGHFKTTFGNITNLDDVRNLKQEIKARDISIQQICSIDNIISCIKKGARDKYEIAEMLCVSNELFGYSIKYHARKSPVIFKDNIMLYFNENALIII
ncbi:ImmA/IrrE family metallo-endopeptidase [Clostridium butyricum]|uniref:ImmA/IrrE family metallo-endopeptidase n=1 Tax=Clostridium butyricum TaxID=1492 RepID=UPI0022E509A9|nr:ImmA/IrrE family metallo-endopeptidase [Clostridium butyricum]